MNKKMRDILGKIKKLTADARNKQDNGDTTGAAEILNQISELRTEYNNERALYEAEKDGIPDGIGTENKANGFAAMAKMAFKKPLTDAENALITNGGSGENYLVPEDVDTTIREMRKSYVSAKDLVTVIPTDSLSGGFTFENGTPVGLTDIEDGEELTLEENPKFAQKKWQITHKGKIFPVSNILLGAEKAGLMPYLNKWFLKNAVISENTDIFTALKTDKTGTTITGLTGLKSAINKLDPSCLIGGVIVTNQSGFDVMDAEVDAIGRPMLSTSPTDPTKKLFKGLPIIVFPDAQLANVSGKAPVFYGSIDSGVYFLEKKGLEFATSEHVYFSKNQIAIRVIEGYAVIQADADAYGYGLLAADTTKVVSTKEQTA